MPDPVSLRRLAVLLLMIAAAGVFVARANAASESTRVKKSNGFDGWQWSIEVPSTYTYESSAKPSESSVTTGFAPAPRADGTRPMIQVTLMRVPAGEDSSAFASFFGEQRSPAFNDAATRGKSNAHA